MRIFTDGEAAKMAAPPGTTATFAARPAPPLPARQAPRSFIVTTGRSATRDAVIGLSADASKA